MADQLGAEAPAYVLIPVQRASSPGELPRIHGRHRRARRQRVQRVAGSWTVLEPRSSFLRGVARSLRATLLA